MSDFSLMNFDRELARFSLVRTQLGEMIVSNLILCASDAQKILGTSDIVSWISNRRPFNKRAEIDMLLSKLGIRDLEGYFCLTYGLSLNDALWIKPASTNVNWDRVNLYRNSFNESISRFAFDGNGAVKGSSSPEFGTDGVLPKCWKRINGNIYLYKGGSVGAVNCGREPFSEYYASQLLNQMGVPRNKWVSYECIKYHNKNTSRCLMFTTEDIGFRPQSQVAYFKIFEDLFNAQMSSKFSNDIKFMYVFDALILNPDRHLGNYGYLVDNHSGNIVDFAPIFDNGLGCLAYFYSRSTGNILRDEIDNYMSSIQMSSGASFDAVARICMTRDIKAKLSRLRGFRLKLATGDSTERLGIVNYVIQKRLKTLLSLN